MIPAHISQNQRKYTQINTHELRSFVNKGKHYFRFFCPPLRHTSLPWYSSNWPVTFGFVLGFTKIMDSKIPISPKKSIKALHFKEINKWTDVVQNLEKYIEICFPQPTSATRTTLILPNKRSQRSPRVTSRCMLFAVTVTSWCTLFAVTVTANN